MFNHNLFPILGTSPMCSVLYYSIGCKDFKELSFRYPTLASEFRSLCFSGITWSDIRFIKRFNIWPFKLVRIADPRVPMADKVALSKLFMSVPEHDLDVGFGSMFRSMLGEWRDAFSTWALLLLTVFAFMFHLHSARS